MRATRTYNRGTLRMQIEDLDGASADFTAALERDPTDVQSRLNRVNSSTGTVPSHWRPHMRPLG